MKKLFLLLVAFMLAGCVAYPAYYDDNYYPYYGSSYPYGYWGPDVDIFVAGGHGGHGFYGRRGFHGDHDFHGEHGSHGGGFHDGGYHSGGGYHGGGEGGVHRR
jgi:hypothetical protein